MKKILFYLFCFGLITNVYVSFAAGKPSFRFRKTTADFGTIDRKKTKQIIVNFEFVNHDTSSLVILKAVPMCGCMTAGIPAEPIAKGGKGIVKVVVDPKNQEGEFNKAIIVKTSADSEPVIFRIEGFVK